MKMIISNTLYYHIFVFFSMCGGELRNQQTVNL